MFYTCVFGMQVFFNIVSTFKCGFNTCCLLFSLVSNNGFPLISLTFHDKLFVEFPSSGPQLRPWWNDFGRFALQNCIKRLVGGDWNMTCIFPYIGTNHPNWLSYFWNGMKPPTRRIWIISIWCSQSIQTQRKFKSKSIQIKLNINWERNQPEKSDQFIFSWLTFPLL